MLHIGCHLPSSDGYLNMGKTALGIGADTFQFFTRNPRGSKAKPFNKPDCDALVELLKEHDFAPLVAHAPYTLNPCSADERVRDFAHMVFSEDLEILDNIPGALYNFHPGSHVGQGAEAGILHTINMLNNVLKPGHRTMVLIECMSGKGSEIGATFEEVRQIIDGVKLNEKVGVCLDTCHISDAGYDVVDSFGNVLKEFDRIIGLERLRAIHLNDSMNPRGAHKDRHQKIGQGTIGVEAFEKIINHPDIKNLPFILETPNELDGYKAEIELLRSLYKD